MRILSYFSLALFLLFSWQARAEGSEAQDLIELLAPIHSLQANFVQTIVDNNGKALQKSQGKVTLQRPGQFRWDVRRPIPQLVIANSTRIWIYDPDLEQVVIRPVAKELGKTPAFLLSNMTIAITKDFTVRRMTAPQSWQWFSLTPKNKDNLFNVIQLGFLNHGIKEMRMQDNLGHSTVIQFQQVQENVSLPASLFSFHPPAKVDVIDETKH